ncbi:MAG: serine hydrolase [Rhodothermales bacterium]|nr:serine hydrolase [Rhodothermales bacterium]
MTPRRWPLAASLPVLLLAALVGACASPPADAVEPPEDLQPVADALSAAIAHELDQKDLGAFSIALVDSQQTVFAAGFGEERPGVPADASTIYRVGSVSKLFTDLAVMQLVDRGELDLDAPVTEYLPDFAPEGPTPTLRQLMSHQSGIVREPPVGHYFDPTEPTLAATVASLNGTPRIYPPESRTKYSNAAIATVGYVLEGTQQTPFVEYVRESVLAPLGMTRSSFAPTAATRDRLANAVMWSYDGREFPAPTFELGMIPAGSMYAPVTDLGRFMSAVFTADPALGISRETLDEMLSPQFGQGFGIGFSLGELDGHRYAGHGGAIYGFATLLGMLPDEQLGVVAVTTTDVANNVVWRVSEYALRLMMAQRQGDPLPEYPTTDPLAPGVAKQVQGVYLFPDGQQSFTIAGRPNGAWIEIGRERYLLRARGDTLVIDDRHGYGGFLIPSGSDLMTSDGSLLKRADDWPGGRPDEAPGDLRQYLGEYGWDHNVLFVYERAGSLHALIEWTEMNPLTPSGPDAFDFPADGGLYHGEQIRFERDASGVVEAAVAAGIRFERRKGPATGETYTIDPVRPIEELRVEALAATPPAESGDFREPDLVEVRDLAPGILYDLRYAGTNNFMETVFYQSEHAFLQRPAAEALVRAHQKLAAFGYGVIVHDAYRPWFVTKMFWDATPDDQKDFVANPANGSRHNRGAAVDLTLYDLGTGEPVEMPSGYDEFSERSYAEYVGGTAAQRWRRDLLREVMESEGFQVYAYEWWHFDHADWRAYPILNDTFEALQSR